LVAAGFGPEVKPTPTELGEAEAEKEAAYKAKLKDLGVFADEKGPSVAQLNRTDRQAANGVALRFGEVYNNLSKNIRAKIGVGAVSDVSSMQAVLKKIMTIGKRELLWIDEFKEDLGTPEQIQSMVDLGVELNAIYAGKTGLSAEDEARLQELHGKFGNR
jgi:hypothetical protein